MQADFLAIPSSNTITLEAVSLWRIHSSYLLTVTVAKDFPSLRKEGKEMREEKGSVRDSATVPFPSTTVVTKR